jgi:hypothetical protein
LCFALGELHPAAYRAELIFLDSSIGEAATLDDAAPQVDDFPPSAA